MRIIVLGDFHMNKEDQSMSAGLIEDINKANPDLVIPLGDYGTGDNIGLTEGLDEAYYHLSQINCQLRPIIGNHDLHFEMGNHLIPKGTFAKYFKEKFDLKQAYDVMEFENYRLFFICNDNMPDDVECLCIQECYISQTQMDWIKAKIEERPGIPCLFFSHAPMANTGLKDIPKVHVRSTNAYLNQNFEPHKMTEFVESHPEIVMWFSAHYHLGHDQENAHSYKYQTHFFTTGVHTDFTRDGNRHSRVIDIEDTSVTISTLDHEARGIKKVSDWQMEKPIRKLLDPEHKYSLRTPSTMQLPETKNATLKARCRISDDKLAQGGFIPYRDGHLLLMTEGGYLWDVDLAHGILLGTYHAGEPLSAAAATKEYIVKGFKRNLKFAKSTDLTKYIREVEVDAFTKIISPRKAYALYPLRDDIFAVGADGSLYFMKLVGPTSSEILSVHQVDINVMEIIGTMDDIYLLDKAKGLYTFDTEHGETKISEMTVLDSRWVEGSLHTIESEGMDLYFITRKNGVIVDQKKLELTHDKVGQVIIKDNKSLFVKDEAGLYLYTVKGNEMSKEMIFEGDYQLEQIYTCTVGDQQILLGEYYHINQKETFIDMWYL